MTRAQAATLLDGVERRFLQGNPLPVVTGINPPSGPAAGGTQVAITGSGFDGARARCSSQAPRAPVPPRRRAFWSTPDGQITLTPPPGSAGAPVDVEVVTPAGASAPADRVTYQAAGSEGGLVTQPIVTGVNPSGGAAAGGTVVTIPGLGFTGATAVAFGGAAATSFTVVSDGEIQATAPPGRGTVDVTVTTTGGTSGTGAADRFTATAFRRWQRYRRAHQDLPPQPHDHHRFFSTHSPRLLALVGT